MEFTDLEPKRNHCHVEPYPRHPRSSEESSHSPLQFEALEPRVLFSATMIEPVESVPTAHHDLPLVQDEKELPALPELDKSLTEEASSETNGKNGKAKK